MTNKETIKGLSDLKELAKELIFEDSDDMLLSIDNAIKTLEREETTQWYLAEEFNTWECKKCYYQAHVSGINYCPNCGRKIEREE